MLDNCLTNKIEYKADKQYLICLIMKEKTITIREFLRNYKKFASQKNTIIITKNGKPKHVFMPYAAEEKNKNNKRTQIKAKTLWDAIEKYTFKSGGKNLSQNIDEIVYGYPNPHRK